MDTKRFHHFKTLAQTGHLRRAAELLNITHAGLSKSIRMLEEELGVELTSRDGRGIRITPAGTVLLEKMNLCLQAEAELLASIEGTSLAPSLRIGTFEVFSTHLAPKIVAAIEKHTPIQLLELIPGELEQALTELRIDCGITYLPIPKPHLDHLEITKIRMGVFGTTKWYKDSVPFNELPFVVPVSEVEGTPTKVKGLDGWPDGRVFRQVRYSVTLMETALALTRSGLAVAYLPKFVVHLHNEIVQNRHRLYELPIPKGIDTRQAVYAVKRKDQEETRSFKALCRVLRGLDKIKDQ